MSIARTRAVVGSLYALMRNALGLNVATPLESQELSCTVSPDRRLVVLGNEPIAGFARTHGTVADEAAMLALHTLDSATLLAEPTFVAPGDSCLRTDDPGWRWHCISGHGQSLSDWERRPLAGAPSELGSGIAGAQPLDADLTAIAAQGVSATGLALLSIAPATGPKIVQINADGTVTLIDVPTGEGAGSGGAEQLIAEVEVTTEGPTVVFADIPQTFRHLRLTICGGWAGTPDWITIRCNADTAANYDWSTVRWTGGSVYPGGVAGTAYIAIGDIPGTASVGGLITGMLFGYRSAWHKQWRGQSACVYGDSTSDYHPREQWGRWRSTAAVTSLTVGSNVAGNFREGTLVSLYGVL